MMMIMIPTPRIWSSRRWIPNGQGKLRTRRSSSLITIGERKVKQCNKIGIILKEMRYNDCINQLHHNAWIDYNNRNQAICTLLSGEDEGNINSVARKGRTNWSSNSYQWYVCLEQDVWSVS